MASVFYGLNRGSSNQTALVVEGTSTGSTDVELRIDTGKSTTILDVVQIVDTILQRLQSGNLNGAPPTL